jgi:Domain of unknown function (DUF3885)
MPGYEKARRNGGLIFSDSIGKSVAGPATNASVGRAAGLGQVPFAEGASLFSSPAFAAIASHRRPRRDNVQLDIRSNATSRTHPTGSVMKAPSVPITFGPQWQRELWESPYRLRFALSTGGRYLNMFTSAYDRARSLARAALPSEQVIAVVAAFPDASKKIRAKRRGWLRRRAYDVLKEMGVPTTQAEATWKDYTYPQHVDDPDMYTWEHRAVSVTWDQADILLWNQVAQDVGVTPQAPVLSKLVDIERGVTVYAYDDRGMDITALSPDPIMELYTRFDGWLLDYDRPRMSEAFAVK